MNHPQRRQRAKELRRPPRTERGRPRPGWLRWASSAQTLWPRPSKARRSWRQPVLRSPGPPSTSRSRLALRSVGRSRALALHQHVFEMATQEQLERPGQRERLSRPRSCVKCQGFVYRLWARPTGSPTRQESSSSSWRERCLTAGSASLAGAMRVAMFRARGPQSGRRDRMPRGRLPHRGSRQGAANPEGEPQAIHNVGSGLEKEQLHVRWRGAEKIRDWAHSGSSDQIGQAREGDQQVTSRRPPRGSPSTGALS